MHTLALSPSPASFTHTPNSFAPMHNTRKFLRMHEKFSSEGKDKRKDKIRKIQALKLQLQRHRLSKLNGLPPGFLTLQARDTCAEEIYITDEGIVGFKPLDSVERQCSDPDDDDGSYIPSSDDDMNDLNDHFNYARLLDEDEGEDITSH